MSEQTIVTQNERGLSGLAHGSILLGMFTGGVGGIVAAVIIWLTQKEKNGVSDSEVGWNFQKYMIDAEGHLVDYAEPRTKPDDPKIVNWVKGDS